MLDAKRKYRCAFSKSLHQNRRTLHAQAIAYLKALIVAELPRQRVLQKVEALTELEESIEKWARRLQRAEDQRLRVRQRLLGHVAAIFEHGPNQSQSRHCLVLPKHRRDKRVLRVSEGL
jgi:gamma-glutamyl phosphate reductase